MEAGLSPRSNRWHFLWLCFTSALPLFVLSRVAPGGVFAISPILIALLVELGKAGASYCLPRRPLDHSALPARPSDDDDETSPVPLRKDSLSKYTLAQLGGLSLLSTINTLMFFAVLSLAPVSTLVLAQTFSNIASLLIDAFYFQQGISGQHWLVICIQLAGFLASQWHDCAKLFLAPLWLYVLLFALVFLQQIAHLWHQLLLRQTDSPMHNINTLLAIFSIPLLLWSWFSLPSDIYPLDIPTAGDSVGFSRVFGTISIIITLIVSQMAQTTQTSAALAPAQQTLLPVVSMWLLYASDYLSGSAYVTVNVFVGLCMVNLAVVSMNAIAFAATEDGSPPPSHLARFGRNQRRTKLNKDFSVAQLITSGLPEFVVAKCSWKSAVASVLFFVILLFVLQDASYEESAFVRKINADLKSKQDTGVKSTIPQTEAPAPVPLTQRGDEKKPTKATETMAPEKTNKKPGGDGNAPSKQRQLEPLPSNMEYYTNGHFLSFENMKEYQEAEEDVLMDLYMEKRGDWKKKRKSAAVCLAGLLRSGFANDLQWLHTLYKVVDTYDLFVWHTPDSVPFELGMLHPRVVSFNRWLPPPNGMNKKFKYTPRELEDWSIHMWGYGFCSTMIEKHMNATGSEYDYLLISSPNVTFTDSPLLPSTDEWNTTAVSLLPHASLTERAIFGPFPLVSKFVPLLYPSIMTWPGNRSPTEFAQFVAESKGIPINPIR